MLLSVLLQAAAAGVGLSKLGAALGAGLAVIGAGIGILLKFYELSYSSLSTSTSEQRP